MENNMSENTESGKPEEKKMSSLEKIQILANLANGVQNEDVKKAILALPSGERLYQIFVAATSHEIDMIMNPAASTPPVLQETAVLATNLRNMIAHMYQAMSDMNKSQLMMVLGVMNQKLGGAAPAPLPETVQAAAPAQQGTRDSGRNRGETTVFGL